MLSEEDAVRLHLSILWRTVTEELPTLIPQLEGLLKAGGQVALT